MLTNLQSLVNREFDIKQGIRIKKEAILRKKHGSQSYTDTVVRQAHQPAQGDGVIILPVGFLFLTCKPVQSHGGRLSSVQNCIGNLRGIGGAAAGGCEAMEGVGAPGTPQSP